MAKNAMQKADFVVPSIVPLFFFLCIFLQIVMHAWIYEDAFISFRVIDNFVNGYGLRWNVDERVQVFTHPLWLLLHIPFVYLFGRLYHVSLGLSFVCIFLTFALVFSANKDKPRVLLATFLLPLFLSSTFITYSTSGLESCLTILLLTMFFVVLRRSGSEVSWGLLSLTVSLSAFNRMDTVLLYLPIALYMAWRHFGEIDYKKCLLGALPFLMWLVFSLLYYGSIFPNTRHAKLVTGVATSAYVNQGIVYLYDLIQRDPVSSILLSLLAIVSFACVLRRDGLAFKYALLGLGGVLYSLYVIFIGGDHSAFRMWHVPVFLSALLMVFVVEEGQARLSFSLAVLFLASYFVTDFAGARWITGRTQTGIFDQYQRNPHAHIGQNISSDGVSQFALAKRGLDAREKSREIRVISRSTASGIIGYYAGPDVIFMDAYGLCDPLLSRLPVRDKKKWRIGHFLREIPYGYAGALGDARRIDKMDANLADYYRKIRIITRDPVFSVERAMTVYRFNAGKYDHLVEAYIEKQGL